MKKRTKVLMLVLIAFCLCAQSWLFSAAKEKLHFGFKELEGRGGPALSPAAKKLLEDNGFVVTPGHEKEMHEVYDKCKRRN